MEAEMTDTDTDGRPDAEERPLIPAEFDRSPIPPELAADEPPLSDEALELIASAGADKMAELVAAEKYELGEVAATVQRWEVTDEGAAEWALATVAARRDEMAEVERSADAYRRRIAEWERKRTTPLRNVIVLLEAKLMDYAARKRAESKGKIKTISMPSGSVSSRSGQDKLEVTDEEALIAWLESSVTPAEFESCVKVTKKPLLTGLKATLSIDKDGRVFYAETGEVPPGVEFVRAGVTYKVNPS